MFASPAAQTTLPTTSTTTTLPTTSTTSHSGLVVRTGIRAGVRGKIGRAYGSGGTMDSTPSV